MTGGPDKAVYAYACEDTAWCDDHYRRPLGTAPFGENHPACGVDVSGARIGERSRGGSALLELCQSRARLPCFKLALRHDDPHAARRFARARRPGADPWIVEDGALGAGDEVRMPAQARARGHDRARQRDLPVRSRSSVHSARGPRLAGWPRDWAALGGPL